MKSLKEITAKRLALSERVLSPKEASMVIVVIKSMRGETSDYDVDDDNKLKHWHKETEGLVTREYINGKILKEIGMYRNGNKEYEDWFDLQGNYHREQTGKNLVQPEVFGMKMVLKYMKCGISMVKLIGKTVRLIHIGMKMGKNNLNFGIKMVSGIEKVLNLQEQVGIKTEIKNMKNGG